MKKAGIPRYVGTDGEKKVIGLVKDEFSSILNTSATEQDFSVSNYYMSGVLNLLHPIIGFLLISINILFVFHLYNISFIVTGILFPIALFNRQIAHWFQFRIQRLGKLIPTKNLIFEIPPEAEIMQNLIILAHTDSISHVVSPIMEGIGYFAGFIGGLAFAIHSIILHTVLKIKPGTSISEWGLIWGVPIALISIIELFNKKGNKSLGILDDLSGLGQMHNLAQNLVEEPLKNTKIWLVATGAEELGDYGAYYFLNKYKEQLPRSNSRFIIVDSVGTPTSNQIIYGIGYPVRHFSPKLESCCRKLLEETPSPLKMRTIPPLLQVATDHVPIDKEGYECILFISSDFVIHGKKDNWEAISPEIFFQICDFIEGCIRKMDNESSDNS